MLWRLNPKYKEVDKYETTVDDGDQRISVEITLYRHQNHGAYQTKSKVLGVITCQKPDTGGPLPPRRKRRHRSKNANPTQ